MDEYEEMCCQIISLVGSARSCYVEAIHMAKDKQIEEAKKHLEEGNSLLNEGKKYHLSLLQKEASSEIPIKLLLMHAEDLQMSAENFCIIAEEFVDLYERLN